MSSIFHGLPEYNTRKTIDTSTILEKLEDIKDINNRNSKETASISKETTMEELLKKSLNTLSPNRKEIKESIPVSENDLPDSLYAPYPLFKKWTVHINIDNELLKHSFSEKYKFTDFDKLPATELFEVSNGNSSYTFKDSTRLLKFEYKDFNNLKNVASSNFDNKSITNIMSRKDFLQETLLDYKKRGNSNTSGIYLDDLICFTELDSIYIRKSIVVPKHSIDCNYGKNLIKYIDSLKDNIELAHSTEYIVDSIAKLITSNEDKKVPGILLNSLITFGFTLPIQHLLPVKENGVMPVFYFKPLGLLISMADINEHSHPISKETLDIHRLNKIKGNNRSVLFKADIVHSSGQGQITKYVRLGNTRKDGKEGSDNLADIIPYVAKLTSTEDSERKEGFYLTRHLSNGEIQEDFFNINSSDKHTGFFTNYQDAININYENELLIKESNKSAKKIIKLEKEAKEEALHAKKIENKLKIAMLEKKDKYETASLVRHSEKEDIGMQVLIGTTLLTALGLAFKHLSK